MFEYFYQRLKSTELFLVYVVTSVSLLVLIAIIAELPVPPAKKAKSLLGVNTPYQEDTEVLVCLSVHVKASVLVIKSLVAPTAITIPSSSI